MNKNKTTTMAALPLGRILLGDARERLARLPTDSVDCVITSPPYFALRNYQVEGQLGLESTVQEWVTHLVTVLDEVARVLKPTGSVWLNVGDSYSRHQKYGAPPKGLLLGPERLAIALADAGWRVRNKVVWHKPNGRPTSTRDRLACSWEPIYLLTRSRFPYFDLDAIRLPHQSQPKKRREIVPEQVPKWQGPLAGKNDGLAKLHREGRAGHVLGKNPRDVWRYACSNYRGGHFATFPEKLLERPLLATCPERVCTTCGVPWRRSPLVQQLGATAIRGALRKSCPCPKRAWQPGVVLDPFMGAGTTAVAAEKLSRDWLGIELNAQFVELAEQRLRQTVTR